MNDNAFQHMMDIPKNKEELGGRIRACLLERSISTESIVTVFLVVYYLFSAKGFTF